jgi:hypothetical protein
MKTKLITIEYEEYKELIKERNKNILAVNHGRNLLLDNLKRIIQENSEDGSITLEDINKIIFGLKQGVTYSSMNVEKEMIEMEMV